MFVQVTAESVKDVPIPHQAGGEGFSIRFGVIEMAQALGDRQALMEAGRHVIRFYLERAVAGDLKRLTEAVGY
jgi:hypothetical protein